MHRTPWFRASVLLLALLILAPPVFGAGPQIPGRTSETGLSALASRFWETLALFLPLEKRGADMDPWGVEADSGDETQSQVPDDGERGIGMDPWG